MINLLDRDAAEPAVAAAEARDLQLGTGAGSWGSEQMAGIDHLDRASPLNGSIVGRTVTFEHPELHAVVEVGSRTAPAWVPLPPDPWPRFVRLWDGTSMSEVSLVVAMASSYGHGGTGPAESAKALLYDFPKVLPGGLAAVWAERSALPGCCCGLETWTEWQQVIGTRSGPWTGHDPSPLVEVIDDEVHVWSDGAMSGKPAGEVPIRFTRSEFETALEQVRCDLDAFLKILRRWLDEHAPLYAKRIVERFQSTFVRPRGRRR